MSRYQRARKSAAWSKPTNCEASPGNNAGRVSFARLRHKCSTKYEPGSNVCYRFDQNGVEPRSLFTSRNSDFPDLKRLAWRGLRL